MERFEASLDNTAKMITTIVCVVLVIPFITIAQYYMATHDARLLIAPVLITLTFIFLALWRPTAYSLDSAGLHIHRALGTKTIAADRLAGAARSVKADMGTGIRTFGSGGAFGYLGMFYYSGMGSVKMYVTNRENMLMITLADGKRIMISPDLPDTFLAAFSKLKK